MRIILFAERARVTKARLLKGRFVKHLAVKAMVCFALFVVVMFSSSEIGRGLTSADPIAFAAGLVGATAGIGGLGLGCSYVVRIVRCLLHEDAK